MAEARKIQERNPESQIDLAPICIGYRVRLLSRVITGIYDDALAPVKLKGSQFNLLDVLSRRGPILTVELNRLTKMDKSTASRNLERLRRRGWLSLSTTPGTKGQSVSISPRGLKILRAAYPLWLKAQNEAMRRLGSEGAQALRLIMRSIDD